MSDLRNRSVQLAIDERLHCQGERGLIFSVPLQRALARGALHTSHEVMTEIAMQKKKNTGGDGPHPLTPKEVEDFKKQRILPMAAYVIDVTQLHIRGTIGTVLYEDGGRKRFRSVTSTQKPTDIWHFYQEDVEDARVWAIGVEDVTPRKPVYYRMLNSTDWVRVGDADAVPLELH